MQQPTPYDFSFTAVAPPRSVNEGWEIEGGGGVTVFILKIKDMKRFFRGVKSPHAQGPCTTTMVQHSYRIIRQQTRDIKFYGSLTINHFWRSVNEARNGGSRLH